MLRFLQKRKREKKKEIFEPKKQNPVEVREIAHCPGNYNAVRFRKNEKNEFNKQK